MLTALPLPPSRSNTGVMRFSSLVKKTVSPLADLSDSTELTREQFKELLGKIDSGLRALPATAQVGSSWQNTSMLPLHAWGAGAACLACAPHAWGRDHGASVHRTVMCCSRAECAGIRRHLPHTCCDLCAQVARQQGEYLASLFASNSITGKAETTRLASTQQVRCPQAACAGAQALAAELATLAPACCHMAPAAPLVTLSVCHLHPALESHARWCWHLPAISWLTSMYSTT